MSGAELPSTESVSILIVNPNSSQIITDAIASSIRAPPGVTIETMTGPKGSPPSIDDEATSTQSTNACFPEVVKVLEDRAGSIQAVLVACYSDHPLVARLLEEIRARGWRIRVIGILEASITHALLLSGAGGRFGIVTTGKAWEPVLSEAVNRYLGTLGSGTSRFAGVLGTGLGVLALHGNSAETQIGQAALSMVEQGAGVICLGCAGMVGLEKTVKDVLRAAGKEAFVVDGVQAGVHLLAGLVRTCS